MGHRKDDGETPTRSLELLDVEAWLVDDADDEVPSSCEPLPAPLLPGRIADVTFPRNGTKVINLVGDNGGMNQRGQYLLYWQPLERPLTNCCAADDPLLVVVR